MSDEFRDEDLRGAYAALMADLARAVRGFGALVRAEVDQAETPHEDEVTEALEAVGEARAHLTELLTADMQEPADVWQSHGFLLAGVGRVLAELDVQHRLRQRDAHRREAQAVRTRSTQAAERWRSTARRVVRDGAQRAPQRRADTRPDV